MSVNVAIIIPTKGNVEMLKTCVESIYRTQHKFFHVFIADTGSSNDEKNEIKNFCKEKYKHHQNIHLIFYNYYNYSKINNDVVFKHVGDDFDAILFCNNDVEFIDDAISKMVEVYQLHGNIGTVGCKLLFPNGNIQHAGQLIKISEVNGKLHANLSHFGYNDQDLGQYDCNIGVAGNTFACVLTPYSLFKEIGGLNEKYCECFEDVEYNLQCLLKGKSNICIGNVKVYHHESVTRNKNPHKIYRLKQDYLDILMPFIDKNLELLRDKIQ